MTVCPPAWRRRYIGGSCGFCIVCAGMEQINGKSPCKDLCAVLWRGRYNFINGKKRAVNACMGLYCSRAKQKPCTLSRCKAKEKPRHVGGVEYESASALAAPNVIICCGHDCITAADLDNNAITGAGLACIVSGGIQSGHGVNPLNGGSSHYIALLTCSP